MRSSWSTTCRPVSKDNVPERGAVRLCAISPIQTALALIPDGDYGAVVHLAAQSSGAIGQKYPYADMQTNVGSARAAVALVPRTVGPALSVCKLDDRVRPRQSRAGAGKRAVRADQLLRSLEARLRKLLAPRRAAKA